MSEEVEHPTYYNEIYDKEVIDIIKFALTKEEYIGFCKGNFLKYRLRGGLKEGQPLEKEIGKSMEYLKFLRDEDRN